MNHFLTIGHCCLDKKQDAWVLGGATTYGLRLANQLNIPATLLTSTSNDFDFSILELVDLINVNASVTTKFVNIEKPAGRQQTIESVAAALFPSALQNKYRDIKMVHLCPVAQEVDLSFLHYFSENTVICVSPQGWLRSWDEDGKVAHIDFKDYHLWKRANIVVLSEEEIGNTAPELLAENFDYFILTNGGEGANLYHRGTVHHFPVQPNTNVVDTTGAGDVFAAAFLFKLVESDDPILAMRFATTCAACCVEGEGIGFAVMYDL